MRLSGELYIQDRVSIRKHQVFHGDQPLLIMDQAGRLRDFLRSGYDLLEMDYPKFHKMDELSRLGILAAEVLAGTRAFPGDTALVFSNRASSLETDRDFQESMRDFPSPSVFVYTLPNIVQGEISIRHGIRGENAFFISETFDAALLETYTASLLKEAKASEVLCGWLDLDNGEYDVFLFRVGLKGKLPFNRDIINDLYHS